MRFIVSSIITLLFTIFPFDHVVEAAEIRNILTGQTAKQAYIQYDLIGKPGEKVAEVLITLNVDGRLYNSDRLALSGDFGKNVTVGIGKRIWWDLLKDMPAGFSGEINWDIDTVGILSNDFFEVSPRSVLDKTSGLMWAKLGKYSSQKFTYDRAQSFVKAMNEKKFAGFSDWRLPHRDEMKKLYSSVSVFAENKKIQPFELLKSTFSGLENWNYWTGFTAFGGGGGQGPNYKWSFDIERGSIGYNKANEDLCILPVRADRQEANYDYLQ